MRLQMGKDSAKRQSTEKQHLKRRRPVQVISRLVPFYFDLCPHHIFKRLNIFMHFEYNSSQTQFSSFSNSITKVFQFVFEWWLPFYECRQRIVRDFSLLICVWVSRFTQLFHQIPERKVECRRKKLEPMCNVNDDDDDATTTITTITAMTTMRNETKCKEQ